MPFCISNLLSCKSNGKDGNDDDHSSCPYKKYDAVNDQSYNGILFVKLYEHFHRFQFFIKVGVECSYNLIPINEKL